MTITEAHVATDSWLERYDAAVAGVLPSYFELIADRAEGSWITDVEGRRFLDFGSGIAVTNVGHGHPTRRRGHRAPGARPDPHVGRLPPRPLHRAGRGGGPAHPVLRPAAGVPVQLRRRGGRRRAQAGPQDHRQGRGHRLPPRASTAGRWRPRPSPRRRASTARATSRSSAGSPSWTTASPASTRARPRRSRAALAELDAVLSLQLPDGNVGAMIVEPVLGEGGYVVPPVAWLEGLRRRCDEHGIVLIFDEVQCGMGRTGHAFAAETFGVAPDVILFAKGIASGLPLGGIVAPAALMERWPNGAHGSTFGGNPVACAAALATIEVLRGDDLFARAELLGTARHRAPVPVHRRARRGHRRARHRPHGRRRAPRQGRRLRRAGALPRRRPRRAHLRARGERPAPRPAARPSPTRSSTTASPSSSGPSLPDAVSDLPRQNRGWDSSRRSSPRSASGTSSPTPG